MIAKRQHGAFSHRQAVSAGLSPRQIGHRRAVGAWVDLEYAVYALDSSPETWHREVMAAVLSKNHARASGFTAGVLHELPHCRAGKPEISVPSTGNAVSRIAVVRRRSDTRTRKLVLIDRIPTFDAATTLFDLAPRLSAGKLRRAIDDCLVRGRVTPEELVAVLETYTGSRMAGTVRFRDVIKDLSGAYVATESELEGLLFALLDDPRIPNPERQARLTWWDELPHRVDANIPPWRLIVEGDGRTYHTKREDFERDRHRDNLAVAHGYRVLRFTYRMLKDAPADALRVVLRTGAQAHHSVARA